MVKIIYSCYYVSRYRIYAWSIDLSMIILTFHAIYVKYFFLRCIYVYVYNLHGDFLISLKPQRHTGLLGVEELATETIMSEMSRESSGGQ